MVERKLEPRTPYQIPQYKIESVIHELKQFQKRGKQYVAFGFDGIYWNHVILSSEEDENIVTFEESDY